jgi:hypothetical protein
MDRIYMNMYSAQSHVPPFRPDGTIWLAELASSVILPMCVGYEQNRGAYSQRVHPWRHF